jgi:hypothetical protein
MEKVYIVNKHWHKEMGRRKRAFANEQLMVKAVVEDVSKQIGYPQETITAEIVIENMFYLHIKSIEIYHNGEHLPNWHTDFDIIEIEK